MAEEDGDSGKKLFDISRMWPRFQHNDVEYVSKISASDVSEKLLEILAEDAEISDEALALKVVEYGVNEADADDQLSHEMASVLASSPEFLDSLIAADKYVFWVPSSNEGKTRERIALARDEGESTASFLTRAVRDYSVRARDRRAEIDKIRAEQFKRLSESLSLSGIEALQSNNLASDNLSALIENASELPFLDRTESHDSGFLRDHYAPPPNPIYETNATLADLAGSIEQMRALAFEQAVMQQSLNSVATELLDNFVVGSKSAERHSWIALAIAVLAVVVTSGTFVYSQFFDDSTEAQIMAEQATAEILLQIRDDARSGEVQSEARAELLLGAIEDIETELEERQRTTDSVE